MLWVLKRTISMRFWAPKNKCLNWGIRKYSLIFYTQLFFYLPLHEYYTYPQSSFLGGICGNSFSCTRSDFSDEILRKFHNLGICRLFAVLSDSPQSELFWYKALEVIGCKNSMVIWKENKRVSYRANILA